MTDTRTFAAVSTVGVALLASAWITDVATGQRPGGETPASEWLIYLVGLAYWTYTLLAKIILSGIMSILYIEHYPAHVLPPPVTHFYPDQKAYQFTASVIATVLSIVLYSAIALSLRPVARKRPGLGRRFVTSLLAGYAATAILWPLVSYRSSPIIDALRTLTVPLDFVYRAFGHTYPFTPGFAGATLPQFTYLSAAHVVLIAVPVFAIHTIIVANPSPPQHAKQIPRNEVSRT